MEAHQGEQDNIQRQIFVPYNFEAFYCNLKFFGIPEGYEIVAAVILPDHYAGDVEGLRLRCLNTGKVSGKVVNRHESTWPAVYEKTLAPQFRIVRANLADFAAFSKDPEGNIRDSGDIRLEVVDAFGRPIAADFDFTWYHNCTLPLPPTENIIRVAGDIGIEGFLLTGATWHARLEKLVRRYLGRELKQLERILDWGVGCGRIARHFLERGHANIFGVDIDEVNITWLRSNFGWQNASRIDFDPPMPYPDNHFDLIYGHSIFTHLAYSDHFLWIKEITRILKPGGFAFLTVATEDGLFVTRYDRLGRELTRQYIVDGFVDVENHSYTGVDAGREGYYRLVFQTRRFILENWGMLLSIQKIIPCYFEHQDLVIARK
jgi:SAM-dependent methyltransferase